MRLVIKDYCCNNTVGNLSDKTLNSYQKLHISNIHMYNLFIKNLPGARYANWMGSSGSILPYPEEINE